MTPVTTGDPAQLTAQYEVLRAQALSGSAAVATPLGLAVFLRRGLAAWLAICTELLSRPRPKPEPPVATGGPPVLMLAGVQVEAVRVLASMALAACGKGGS